MKTCLLFGIFDDVTPEIQAVIEQAQSKCEHLIVMVASDEMAHKFRDDIAHEQDHRLQMMKEHFPSLEIFPSGHLDSLEAVRTLKPDKIFLGANQIGFRQDLSEAFPNLEIERLDPVGPFSND